MKIWKCEEAFGPMVWSLNWTNFGALLLASLHSKR